MARVVQMINKFFRGIRKAKNDKKIHGVTLSNWSLCLIENDALKK